MTKFSASENSLIAEGRKNNPGMSQRGLATYIVNNSMFSYEAFYGLFGRTQASVYGAIRRHDRAVKAAQPTTKRGRRNYVSA